MWFDIGYYGIEAFWIIVQMQKLIIQITITINTKFLYKVWN